MHFSSYFNPALAQKRTIIVTQVNLAPPTAIPEGLFYLYEAFVLGEAFKLSPRLTWSQRIVLTKQARFIREVSMP